MSECPPRGGIIRPVEACYHRALWNLLGRPAERSGDWKNRTCWNDGIRFQLNDECDSIGFYATVKSVMPDLDSRIDRNWLEHRVSKYVLLAWWKYELPRRDSSCSNCYEIISTPMGFGEILSWATWCRIRITLMTVWDRRNEELGIDSEAPPTLSGSYQWQTHVIEQENPDCFERKIWRMTPWTGTGYLDDYCDGWIENDIPTSWLGVLLSISVRNGIVRVNTPDLRQGFCIKYGRLSYKDDHFEGETYPGIAYYNDWQICEV